MPVTLQVTELSPLTQGPSPPSTYPQPPPLPSWESQGCEVRELGPPLGSLASESLGGRGEGFEHSPGLRTRKGREKALTIHQHHHHVFINLGHLHWSLVLCVRGRGLRTAWPSFQLAPLRSLPATQDPPCYPSDPGPSLSQYWLRLSPATLTLPSTRNKLPSPLAALTCSPTILRPSHFPQSSPLPQPCLFSEAPPSPRSPTPLLQLEPRPCSSAFVCNFSPRSPILQQAPSKPTSFIPTATPSPVAPPSLEAPPLSAHPTLAAPPLL